MRKKRWNTIVEMNVLVCQGANWTNRWWISSGERQTLEMSASENLYGDQFALSTQLISQNYLYILPHWRSTTVSLQSYTLYPLVFLCVCFQNFGLYALFVIEWTSKKKRVPKFNCPRLFIFSVANKLKGLFVLFAGYIMKNCASLLDAANISKTGKHPFEGQIWI